jgi:hypothetical protein
MVSKLEKRWLNDSFPMIPTEQMLLVVQKWLQSEDETLLYPGIQYLNDFNEVNGA